MNTIKEQIISGGKRYAFLFIDGERLPRQESLCIADTIKGRWASVSFSFFPGDIDNNVSFIDGNFYFKGKKIEGQRFPRCNQRDCWPVIVMDGYFELTDFVID